MRTQRHLSQFHQFGIRIRFRIVPPGTYTLTCGKDMPSEFIENQETSLGLASEAIEVED